MEHLRILHVISSGGLYGAEQVLLTLASECQSMGHQPIVGSILAPGQTSNDLGAEAGRRGLEHVEFHAGKLPKPKDFHAMIEFAVANRVQILHAHGYKAIILLGLSRLKDRPCPIVCTLHGWTAMSKFSKLGIYEWLARKLTARFDHVVPVASGMVTALPRRLLPERVVVIRNGIRLFLSRRAATGDQQRAQPPVILAVGRLSHEKGFDILLEAAAQLRSMGSNFQVHIVGEGPERRRLELMAAELGLSEIVVFFGFREDLGLFYASASLLVIPSRTEGLPMVLLEAMVAGIPIVATQVGEIPEVLDHGKLGLVVPADSPGALSKAMKSLLEDSSRSADLAVASREKVERHYSSAVMAREYCDVYMRCLGI